MVTDGYAFYSKRQVHSHLYEWLRDYQRLEQEIAYLEFNLEQTERELKRWVGGNLSGVKLEPESRGANVEEIVERIKSELIFKREQKEKLVELIETFKGLDNKILKLKYIDRMTLENIAFELNYSSSHIKKKHAELIRTIKFVDEYSSL